MKSLFYLIVGSLIGWFIWGFIKNDFSPNGYGLLLIGLIIGFIIGRLNPKEETETY